MKEEETMAETPRLTFNNEILGVEQPTGTVQVSEEVIRRYCALLGYPLPPARPGEPLEMPIGLLNVFFTRQVEQGANVKLEGASVGLNAGRAMELLERVRAGDTLTRTAVLKEVYTKTGRSGTMAFEVWEVRFRNQGGRLVAWAQDSMVYRAAGGRAGSDNP